MNISKRGKLDRAGFTVAEMIVAVGVMGLLGGVFFEVLRSGMTLWAKNTAVNAAHLEARDGILRLTRDIHASISVPQLRDASFNVVSPVPSGTQAPMAAGVSFQNIAFGPQYIWRDPGGNGPIMVKGGPNNTAPTVGMHIVAPLFGIEDDITKVTATPTAANHHNIWLAGGGEVFLANKTWPFGATGATYSTLYYTSRVMYLVKNGTYVADSNGDWFQASAGVYVPYVSQSGQRYRYENGELHLYMQSYNGTSLFWQDKGIVARAISSPTPFYIPLVAKATGLWYESTTANLSYTTSSANSTGKRFAPTPYNKYVGVKLTSRDPKSTNRGYLATASLLNTQIDYRSRLATVQ
jgi:type II secretory pathway pseudopilin PulG